MIDIDSLITRFDKGLRTLFAPAQSVRPLPGGDAVEPELDQSQRERVGALMRVNHTGEICAQALYQGQSLTARDSDARRALEQAAQEETEHLAWTAHRMDELGSRRSLLNPLWYAGSFAIGAAAGLLGDRWSLGFLAETERQVVRHLEGHLRELPPEDQKSRAILEQMRNDEERHATGALKYGAAELPPPARLAMRLCSMAMTKTAFWI